MISPFPAGESSLKGALPGKTWGRSSAGRASQWHCEGQGFDPPRLHHSANLASKTSAAHSGLYKCSTAITFVDYYLLRSVPSGEDMRRRTLFIAVAAAALAAPAYANPWSELAIEDLHGIHDIIRDNHPGPVDPENPHYRDWMEGGLVKAVARARVA